MLFEKSQRWIGTSSRYYNTSEPIGVASCGAPGHVPPTLDFKLLIFWRSLASQILDDSCGFLHPVERFSGHLDTVSITFARAYTVQYTHSFVTGFCVLYANFVIGVGAQPTLGQAFLTENICMKNQQNAQILHDMCPKKHFPYFS